MQMNEHWGFLSISLMCSNNSVLEEAHAYMVIVYFNCNFTVQPMDFK